MNSPAVARGQPVRPYLLGYVNEGQTCFLDLTHLNADQELEAPSSLRYRIDNLTDNRNVLAWTSVGTPASENTATASSCRCWSRRR